MTVTYEILVSSFYPVEGSDFGGTLITIEGNNFLPEIQDNAVFLSHNLEDIHLRCVIQTAT